jgi:hypothetical protein
MTGYAKPVRPPFDTAFAKGLNAKLDALVAELQDALADECRDLEERLNEVKPQT